METAPLDFEERAWSRGLGRVVGMDEVGLGPLAGPVVAAAVALPPGESVPGAVDSKRLPAERREELAEDVRRKALGCALGAASCREVERLNPRRAASLAMRRALSRLSFAPELLLVDGREMPGLPDHRALVGGDDRSQSIACASIVAKVVRDRAMHLLHPRYPDYGWITNHGYATAEHLEALASHGPTPHHRRTYEPVAQARLDLDT